MDYRAELQILLDDETMEFEEWLQRYPIQECPRLIQEYKVFMQKYLIERGDFETVQELTEELDNFTEYIENFTIDKLAERQEKLNEAEVLVKKMKNLLEVAARDESGRIEVTEELLEDFKQIIKYLKSQGLYDEKTWENLKHLF